MFVPYALCHGAGLRICDSCARHIDLHPAAARNPNQPHVAATRNDRCPNWKSKPASGAVTPTDTRS